MKFTEQYTQNNSMGDKRPNTALFIVYHPHTNNSNRKGWYFVVFNNIKW